MIDATRVATWLAALAALACVCLWSAADRLARQGVLLDLPTPFLSGGNTLTARAAEALRRGDPGTADRLSRAALVRRPVDAPVLRVAGLAAIAVGDTRRGDVLMRLAGAAGWRDVPTQFYWAEAALASDALDIAAERLDAVARINARRRQTKSLLLRLEATPRGRAALLRRLRIPNLWATSYLSDVDQLDDAAAIARVKLIAGARSSAVTLDAAVVDRLGWGLIERRRGDLAWQLVERPSGRWLTPFRSDVSSQPGPFEWQVQAAAGLEAMFEPRDGRPGLRIVASGPALLGIASQVIRLPAGDWQLTSAIAGAKTPRPLLVALDCVEGSGAAAMSDPAPPGRFSARLRVPAGCPMQRVTLAVTGEEAARDADLWLNSPTVAPVAQPAP
ncbi:MAG: hypothetical protein JWN21_137 [Sphingomonas bacterium]|uniref:hypothetical protein n=1 Tax=Sphingomonas bacterium TaxID=1895847 RepID=UPI00263758E8|nr:hypothetical protein [Sphingomonas bacterium]MDB5694594.1 hypothetical protein [Sphingomonas bacterium]